MANETIKAASFGFGENGALTHLEVDGKKYAADTLAEIDGKGALKGDKLTSAITKAAEGLPKDGSLAANRFDALHGFAETHNGAFTGAQHPLEHIIENKAFSDAYAQAAQGDRSKLTQLLVAEAEQGAHLKHVPSENVAAFRRAMELESEGSYAILKQNLKDGRAISEKLVGTDFSKDIFDKPGSIDKHIDGVLGAHHTTERPVSELKGFISAEAHAHVGAAGGSYSSVDNAIQNFGSKIEESTELLKNQSQKLIELQKKQKSIVPSRASTKAAIAEEIKSVEGSIAAHLEQSAAHGVAYKNLPEGVRKSLDGSAPIKTAGTKAASEIGKDAGKASGGFRLWTKSTEDLAKFAEKDLKGIKGVWNKRSLTGKAALVGVPIVAAGYLAGVGRNPEKGKHTEQALASQAAQGQGAAIGA